MLLLAFGNERVCAGTAHIGEIHYLALASVEWRDTRAHSLPVPHGLAAGVFQRERLGFCCWLYDGSLRAVRIVAYLVDLDGRLG